TGGACQACSVAKGADTDGVCKDLDGAPCNDGSDCTQADTCQGGVCAGTKLPDGHSCLPAMFAFCAGGYACFSGVCQALSCGSSPGSCCASAGCDPLQGCLCGSWKPAGAPCDDGNPCTAGDTCSGGAFSQCVGGPPAACPPPDQCHLAGNCTPSQGCT